MLCACSGEQFRFEDQPGSPESLATRDFSASGLSSRNGGGDWDSKLEDIQVDEAESTLKEALSLNYEVCLATLMHQFFCCCGFNWNHPDVEFFFLPRVCLGS